MRGQRAARGGDVLVDAALALVLVCAGAPQVVEVLLALAAALVGELLARLGPAHLERVHDARHLLLLGARRQEGALVLREGAQRRRQHLAGEPLHPRLRHTTIPSITINVHGGGTKHWAFFLF